MFRNTGVEVFVKRKVIILILILLIILIKRKKAALTSWVWSRVFERCGLG